VKTVTYVEIDIPDFKNDRQAGFFGDSVLERGAGLTGAADSKLLTFAAWVYINTGLGGRLISSVTTLGGGNPGTRAVLGGADNRFNIVGHNSAGAEICNIASSVIPFGEWTHVMGSIDLSDTAKRHIYVNGEEDLASVGTYTNDIMDFTMADWGIGGYPNRSFANILNGAIADLWFQPGVYIDLSDANNRRLFLRPDGNPVNMGADGSHVTGSAPLVFLSGDLATWHTNKGTGGGFTLGQYSDLSEFEAPPRTYRFAIPADYLDDTIEAIPSIDSVSFTPARISLGTDLGQRASLRVNLRDHLHVMNGEPYDQGTFFGKWRGRYETKLRGRKLRLIRGLVGQALADMDTRHYLIEQTDGPTFDGVYTIEAKDVLKFADDDRARAPVVSTGRLAGSINASVTSFNLSPSGVGNELYAASGYVTVGGKEVMSFTRVADAMTVVRGQFGSVAQAHTAGDRVQITLRYDGDDPADIIYDLLVNYAAVPAAYIELAEWQAETADFLGVIYAATITEPTSVKKLVSEIIEQAALALWWDDRAQRIRLNVLREIATDTDSFDHERIIQGSLRIQEQPLKRISQIWTFYGERDPTDSGANEDNFRAVLADVDLELEAEYGSPEIRQIMARWVETETAASRLNSIQLSRFRDPPRQFAFDLVRGEMVTPAAGYTIQWWGSQDETGVEVPVKIQITQVAIYSDRIHIEAEEMLASGVINLVNVVFLTTTGGVLSYTVDASWNDADNSIHTIGGGGGGGIGLFAGGAGGGGGAYSGVTNVNLTPGASVSYQVGTGGDGAAGGDTFFGAATLGASTVGAKGGGVGLTGVPGVGGAAASGVGTIKFSGGDGGDVAGTSGSNGGGGGGAAGPNGDGADGGNGSTNFDAGGGGGGADNGAVGGNGGSGGGGAGGNNRNNFGGGNSGTPSGDEGGGGAGGGSGSASGVGGTGEQIWTQTISPITSAGPGGGGGGGAGNSGAGSNGGLYGGGGGGCGNAAIRGDGAQGIIVIIWREA
jgi:hypothetical protein